ncbi:hypothetical protein UNDKW_1892 [Undibacterium sp. KW1]|uniref:hypothetical protein n=1 Tax=Undibacterium sp. KW1 TaxID=2058624 RepID=UPI001331E27E|nr:hypothetical protein [Undibacterium sp. KW1]BBB60165.1 hypothetical protein UNDKW_1892 [Undibacterium sp. KW1]
MSSENIIPEKEVLLEGTFVGFDGRDLKPFLIEGGKDVEEILLYSRDEHMDEHFRKIGGKVFKILDENFVTVLKSTMFPLCGNCYSYVNKASLRGIVRQEHEEAEFTLEKISMARIVEDEGRVFDLEL